VVLPETADEATEALKSMLNGDAFGSAGETVVIQERLTGQEVSAFAISDGKNAVMLPFFQDHKQVYEGDKGPNTGGMGAYSPVPIVTDEIARKIEEEIIKPTVAGMLADGNEYKGVIYAGLFVTSGGQPKVIEYNSRFGDPECQPMMLLLESDLLELLEGSASGDLSDYQTKISDKAAACVVLTSGGYPGELRNRQNHQRLG
jgi:phosphoribosylamine--glycine ligase